MRFRDFKPVVKESKTPEQIKLDYCRGLITKEDAVSSLKKLAEETDAEKEFNAAFDKEYKKAFGDKKPAQSKREPEKFGGLGSQQAYDEYKQDLEKRQASMLMRRAKPGDAMDPWDPDDGNVYKDETTWHLDPNFSGSPGDFEQPWMKVNTKYTVGPDGRIDFGQRKPYKDDRPPQYQELSDKEWAAFKKSQLRVDYPNTPNDKLPWYLRKDDPDFVPYMSGKKPSGGDADPAGMTGATAAGTPSRGGDADPGGMTGADAAGTPAKPSGKGPNLQTNLGRSRTDKSNQSDDTGPDDKEAARIAKRSEKRQAAKQDSLDDLSFGNAFKRARKAHGGAGGIFTWRGRRYQTNIKGERYVKNPTPVQI